MAMNESKGKRLAFDLNLVAGHDDDNSDESNPCPVCFEPLVANTDDPRTIVTLKCSHKFHLDCIGSAFNAKGFMQCPICKQIEPGEWRYAVDYVDDDDSITEDEEVEEMNPEPFNDLTLGSELCPFQRFRRSFEDPNPFVQSTDQFDMAVNCIYEETIIPIPQYSAISSSQWSYRTGQVPDRNGLLINPLSHGSIQSSGFSGNLPPPDRRMFWSYHDTRMMRGRHYFAHPNFDHSFFNGTENLVYVPMTINNPRLRWIRPNTPMTMGSNHGSTSFAGSSHVNDNGFNPFNRSERLPPLEELGQSELEREFHRMITSDAVGSNRRRRRTIDEIFGLNGGGSGTDNLGGSGGGGNGNDDGLSGGGRT